MNIEIMQLSMTSKMEPLSIGKLSRLSATLELHIHLALPQQPITIVNTMLPIGVGKVVEAMLI